MKEIGQLLKETREKNGVTVEEAAEDLNLKVNQINSIESGELKAFKDVYYLKLFIRDYAKYLGLESEKIVDDFSEFIFDYTSRIPTDAILKGKTKKVQKKILSPYTNSKTEFEIPPFVIYTFIGIVLLVVIYLVIGIFNNDEFNDNVTNSYRGVVNYEFS